MPLANPLANPLFLPVSYVLSAMLGGALLVLLANSRFRLLNLAHSQLFKRWSVWAWIAPVYAGAVLGGELTTLLMVSVLTFQASREYVKLAGLRSPYDRVLPVVSLAAAPMAFWSLEAFYVLPVLLFVTGTSLPIVTGQAAGGVRQLAMAVLGWAYLAWLPAHLLLIRIYLPGGEGVLLALGLGVALSDVGAFVVGKRFGRRKLAPRISPNKTVAGAAGNFIGAAAGIGLLAFALPDWLPVPAVALLAILIAVTAVWGDLFESAIKREFGAKDAGAWLAGFGGLLDRIDSLVIAAPATFYFLYLAHVWYERTA